MICPLCGKNSGIILADGLRGGDPGKVYYCDDCGLGMLENVHDKDEIKEYYASEYRKEFKPDIEQMATMENIFQSYVGYQGERIKNLLPYLASEKKLLDVGCSTGHFLYNALPHVGEVAGIELDPAAAVFAAGKCSCRVYDTYLADSPFEKNYFDIITSFQVMEHSTDPMQFVLDIREYLKDDGRIYIEVPNMDDVLLSVYALPNYNKFYYRKVHLFYFNQKSLLKLMDLAGFTGEIYYEQDYGYFNHMHWLMLDKPQADSSLGFSDLPCLTDKWNNDGNAVQLQEFMKKTNQEYKDLLNKLGLSAKIGFIGQKKK